MAVIKCPECEGNISNTAKMCVHCGCKINVCPECENVWVGENLVCAECGYQVKSEENLDNKEKSQSNKYKDTKYLYDGYMQGISGFNKFLSGKASEIILIVLALICLAVAIYKIFSFGINDLLGYSDMKSTVSTCITFFGIFSILLSYKYYYREHGFYSDYGRWIKDQKVNAKEIIKKSLDYNFNEFVAEDGAYVLQTIQETVIAQIHSEDAIEREKSKHKFVWRTIFTSILIVCLCAFLITNIESLLISLLFYGEIKLGSIGGWWLLLIAIGFFITRIIYGKSLNSRVRTMETEWVSKNLPAQKTVYEKYVLHWGDYLLNQIEKTNRN